MVKAAAIINVMVASLLVAASSRLIVYGPQALKDKFEHKGK